MTGRLLTARVVAQQLGLCTETVLAWVRDGKLPAFKLPGGAIRFCEDDLDAWLEELATSRLRTAPTAPAMRGNRLSGHPHPKTRSNRNAAPTLAAPSTPPRAATGSAGPSTARSPSEAGFVPEPRRANGSTKRSSRG
jgi:excisionase family DNA binding protein